MTFIEELSERFSPFYFNFSRGRNGLNPDNLIIVAGEINAAYSPLTERIFHFEAPQSLRLLWGCTYCCTRRAWSGRGVEANKLAGRGAYLLAETSTDVLPSSEETLGGNKFMAAFSCIGSDQSLQMQYVGKTKVQLKQAGMIFRLLWRTRWTDLRSPRCRTHKTG